MTTNLQTQVELYPQVLRRLAGGEHLASMQDEVEKLGATMLVVEALEKEAGNQANGHAKEAVDPISLILGGAVGAAAKSPIARALARRRGKEILPEYASEVLSAARKTMEAEQAARAARATAVAAGFGGAAGGALLTRALMKKETAAKPDEKSKTASEKEKPVAEEETQKTGQFAQDPPKEVFDTTRADVPPATEKATAAKQARVVLDRVLKNFQR